MQEQQHPKQTPPAALPRRRPKKIRPLPKEVVDRIAAGEVVQRPVSVVKELIENSLDADGTQIDVQCQRGGLDSIAVTDDGTGISPRDLPLACTRFATSKLVEVDDLKSIRTFGFRGEALASASMVARVGITSRVRPRNKSGIDEREGEGGDDDDDEDESPRHANCAYKMQYRDGSPDQKSNPRSKPKPSAGREGTAIQVQDLFYNIPSRRRAMEGRRGERDEYDRILGVVQRYAVHEAKRGVAFLCRGGGGAKAKKGAKGGFGSGNHTDLNTLSLASVKKIQQRRKRARSASSSAAQQKSQESTEEEQFSATRDVIGHIFGIAVTRELLPLTASEGDVEAVSVAALKAMVQKKDNGSSASSTASSSGMDATHGANESNCAQQVEKGDVGSMKKSDEFSNSLLVEMMIGEANEATEKPNDSTDADQTTNNTTSTAAQPSKFAFAYKATGFITNGSYSAPKSSSAFLLFINDRLVESYSIRRAVESVYSDTLPKGGKPFIYLSLELPGPHIDVNVHPTKKEVAFLHEDRLCDAVSAAVKGVIGGATTSRTFSVATRGKLLPTEDEKGDKWNDSRGDSERKRQQLKQAASAGGSSRKESDGELSPKVGKKNTLNKDMAADSDRDGNESSPDAGIADTDSGDGTTEESNLEQQKSDKKSPKKRALADGMMSTQSPKKRTLADGMMSTQSSVKNPYKPSTLVRVNRALPVGALEPFLVKKETKANSPLKQTSVAALTAVKHKQDCPFANNLSGEQIDMSVPGAFASAICRCQIERVDSLPPASTDGFAVRNNANSNTAVRPKKITPTQCDYESITNLRDEITNENHQSLNETLRGSTYVGAVSRSRSLIQCGIDLIMIDHRELAREMYYQVALMKFNGMPKAKLGGGGVDVLAAIGHMLQFEEDLNSSARKSANRDDAAIKVNKTNADLARQATACLAGKAAMLEDYFSIKLEKVKVRGSNDQDQQQRQPATSLRVTGLPILLEGHSPQPHGLPLFLLRLATEVDWMDEQPCFRGICAELASFYSELPFASTDKPKEGAEGNEDGSDIFDFVDEEAKQYIKHTLFPAISYLLVPPKKFADGGAVIKLANLTSLYKVFERC